MSNEIDSFSGGSPSARDKLNALVQQVNFLMQTRGDEQYISVRRGTGGMTVSLNMDAVLARIPKRSTQEAAGIRVVSLVSDGGENGGPTFTPSYTYMVYEYETESSDAPILLAEG